MPKNLYKVLSIKYYARKQINSLLNTYYIIHNTKPNAFTLVELLISVGIMAVVFGIIVSSTSQIQKQGRDTQRQADLRTIQGSLQQYYADQGFFPDSDNTPTANPFFNLAGATSTSTLTSTTGNPATPSPVKTYLNAGKVPMDPNAGTSTPYVYKAYISASNLTDCDNSLTSTTKCNYYELCANLEGSTAWLDCGGFTQAQAKYNLKVTAQ